MGANLRYKRMLTFNNLEWKQHPATISEELKQNLIAKGIPEDSDVFSPMLQAKVQFDNGYAMSVVFGEVFYSNGVDTYEAWCPEVDEDPLGHLTQEQVTEYMVRVQSL